MSTYFKNCNIFCHNRVKGGAEVLKLAHSHTDAVLFLNFYDEYRLQMVNVKAASDNGLPATWWAIPC